MSSPPPVSTTRKSLRRIVVLSVAVFLVSQYRVVKKVEQQQSITKLPQQHLQEGNQTLRMHDNLRTKNESKPPQQLKDQSSKERSIILPLEVVHTTTKNENLRTKNESNPPHQLNEQPSKDRNTTPPIEDVHAITKNESNPPQKLQASSFNENNKTLPIVENLRAKNESSRPQQQEQKESSAPSFPLPSIHPLCSKIPIGATAASIWNKNIDLIYKATIHPNDKGLAHAKWTKELLRLLTPTVLQKSLKTMPWSHKSLHRIYTKLYNRLQSEDQKQGEPLKVFVMGGSIVEGVGCGSVGEEIGVNTTANPMGTMRECAWPFRLEHLLQTLMIGGRRQRDNVLVKVENLAVGGTSSNAARPVLDYWLSPVFEPNGPDIIINAYSANDNLPHWLFAENTTGDNLHPYSKLMQTLGFVQSALKSRPCQDAEPIVVYVDDYLGNQQQSILAEGHTQEMVHLITQWNGLGYISAADMVRPWVLTNTSETFFSAKWTKKRGWRTLPNIDVHFGMSGHVTTLLAVAYGMLQTTLEFCEESRRRAKCSDSKGLGLAVGSSGIDKDVVLSQLQDQTEFDTPPEIFKLDARLWDLEVMRTQNSSIIPNMTHLFWSNASEVWKGFTERQKDAEEVYCQPLRHPQTAGKNSPCAFAFLAAPLGTHKDEGRLNAFLQPFIAEKNFLGGWKAQNDFRQGGYQNKLGLVATRENATVTFDIPNIQTPVRFLTMHYLKSYGPKWEDSRTKFTLAIFNNTSPEQQQLLYTTEFVLEGFHDQNVSIAYPFELDLTPEHQAPAGSSVQLRMNLIGGSNFKINAMMFCSR